MSPDNPISAAARSQDAVDAFALAMSSIFNSVGVPAEIFAGRPSLAVVSQEATREAMRETMRETMLDAVRAAIDSEPQNLGGDTGGYRRLEGRPAVSIEGSGAPNRPQAYNRLYPFSDRLNWHSGEIYGLQSHYQTHSHLVALILDRLFGVLRWLDAVCGVDMPGISLERPVFELCIGEWKSEAYRQFHFEVWPNSRRRHDGDTLRVVLVEQLRTGSSSWAVLATYRGCFYESRGAPCVVSPELPIVARKTEDEIHRRPIRLIDL